MMRVPSYPMKDVELMLIDDFLTVRVWEKRKE